jgi:hypothetical protein
MTAVVDDQVAELLLRQSEQSFRRLFGYETLDDRRNYTNTQLSKGARQRPKKKRGARRCPIGARLAQSATRRLP